MRFGFVHTQRDQYCVRALCQRLYVSKAGYYAWRSRPVSNRCKRDVALLELIRRAHAASRGRYGRPRIHVDLQSLGVRTSGKRIARLMRACGIQGKKRCRSRRVSASPGVLPAAPNVLKRRFHISQPNRVWVSDITQVATAQGWIYLAVVIDCFSRRVIGWAVHNTRDTQLPLKALKMALHNRPYDQLVVHSDRGSQYACPEYRDWLRHLGITPSMSRKGNCWDNAVAESFFATLKVEVKPERSWRTRAQARAAITEYIESWYNPQRRHSANGYLSPIAFEKQHVT